MQQQRVLVITDRPSVSGSPAAVLSEAGMWCVTAAPAAAGGLDGDLLVVDVAEGGTALHVLRWLRGATAGDRPLLALGPAEPAAEVAALDAGADDYLGRPLHRAVLLAHARALLRRRSAAAAPELGFGDLRLDPAAHRVTRSGREVRLTPTEFRLLREFLLHPGQVLPKPALLQHVWGFAAVDDPNVVEVCVYQLRRKLSAAGEPGLIDTVRGVGYTLRAPADHQPVLSPASAPAQRRLRYQPR